MNNGPTASQKGDWFVYTARKSVRMKYAFLFGK
jgi:hypothetical protein